MKVLFVSRSTLFSQPGGDTVQLEQTALYLRKLGIEVDICTGKRPATKDFDIIHFFNLGRPDDALPFLKMKKPLIISSVFVDYSEYDSRYRKGLSSLLIKIFGYMGMEYCKRLGRWLKGQESFPSFYFLLYGQRNSVQKLLRNAKALITTSHQEQRAILKNFHYEGALYKVALGSEHMTEGRQAADERSGVICAARIEGLKNQLNLIKAVKDLGTPLILIGKSAENQDSYIRKCRAAANQNITFTGMKSVEEVREYMLSAKVHAMPSYYETTGLASLEALKMGCQIVITKRGAQEEIFSDHAFYCEPDKVDSIRAAVREALSCDKDHRDWVISNFSWEAAAREIARIYESVAADRVAD